MTNQLRTVACLLAAALVAVGCGGKLLQPQGPAYAEAETVPRLELPPDLITPGYDDRYAVPDPDGRVSAVAVERVAGERVAGERVTTAPLLPEYPGMRLREQAGISWLEVDAAPEDLWPKLREFWRTQNLVLKREEPALGIMETEWAENRADIPLGGVRTALGRVLNRFYDASTRDRYRLRVSRDDAGVTVLYLTHKGAEEEIDSGGVVKWQMRPSEPELEAEMLRRLVIFLGRSEEDAQRMMADGRMAPGAVQVEIVTVDGVPALRVGDDPHRVWNRLGIVLDRISLLVDDQDRSAGIYHVTAVEETRRTDERRGLLARLRGRGDTLREDERYEVHVASHGDHAMITVHGVGGKTIHAADAEMVLERIRSGIY